MIRLVTVLIAAIMWFAPSAQGQERTTFSPLRADTMVAQAVVSDSVSIVRCTPTPEPEQAVDIPGTLAAQTPSGALYRSLALGGWGQWNNGRRDKALLFFVAEAVCIGGYLYENARYTSGDYSGPQKDAIRTDRNTWLLYFMIAKVFDIMDAYVDAQFSSYDIEDITPPELVPPQDGLLP